MGDGLEREPLWDFLADRSLSVLNAISLLDVESHAHSVPGHTSNGGSDLTESNY